jgi:hypothetical protein
VVASHLRPLGIPYDADLVGELSEAGQSLGQVRGNAALMLHEQGAGVDAVVDYLARWSLLSRPRAEKAVEFLTDPTWRAYVFCYIEGVARCRRFVAGDPDRFARLISEQLTPADLGARPAA